MNQSRHPATVQAEGEASPVDKGGLLKTVGWMGLLLLFVCLLMGLARTGEVFESEFGGHPDEAAHYVTGLMVYDYIRDHLGEHPLHFANDYYEHYPKVALGHFPPGFYVVEAVWFLFFSESLSSAILLQAVIAAALGVTIALLIVVAGGGKGIALLVGLLFCSFPLVQRFVGMVMSDLLLSACCVAASLAFAGYLKRPSYRSSLSFGVLAAFAIMTKASGLMLAFVPPLSLILTRRYALFRKGSFWVGAIPVVLVCVPWILLTYKITEEGMVGEWSPAYVAEALPYFAWQLYATVGLVMLLLTVIGVLASVKGRIASGKIPELTAVMLALPLGLGVTYTLIPVGFEQRYLLPALVPLMFFAGLGLRWLWEKGCEREWKQGQLLLGLALVLAVAFGETFEVPKKEFSGFRKLVAAMKEGSDETTARILVSSDARGEGAVVAEVAMVDERPETQVFRGTKVLSTSDWMGRGYQLAHESAEALIEFLRSEPVSWVVVDHSVPDDKRMDHHGQLEVTVARFPEVFQLVASVEMRRKYKGERTEAFLYRVVQEADSESER
jgi:hypothetical protein